MPITALRDEWKSPTGELVRSAAVITTEPNELVGTVHDRMPAILPPEEVEVWLTGSYDRELLQSLLRSYPASDIVMELTPQGDSNGQQGLELI